MTRCIAMVLVVGLMVAAAPVPKEDEVKKDLEKLQGTWQSESLSVGDAAGVPVKNFAITFEKDMFTYKKDAKIKGKGTFKLDPSKKPRVMDIVITDGKKEQDKGEELHCTYDLDKETLKWTMPVETKNGDTQYWTFTLKREKKP